MGLSGLFGADSGTVAVALATGESAMPIPDSVKVTFKGKMAKHMDFRDVVHATQAQMSARIQGISRSSQDVEISRSADVESQLRGNT